jgi:hypothetical protein
MQAVEPQENAQNRLHGAFFPASRGSCAQQLAHDQAQVERTHMSQLPFQNVVSSAQMAAPHSAGFVAMGKAAFHQFAAPPQ